MKSIRLVMALLATSSASLCVSADTSPAKLPNSVIDKSVVGAGVRPVLVVTTVNCPATITVAATNQPSPWFPSAVQLTVQSTTLSAQPSNKQQMICNYAGEGYKWDIGRPIEPEFKTCSPSGKSFLCKKS